MSGQHIDGAGPASLHVPVLYEQVLLWLRPQPGQLLIDATVGLGGHAAGLLERSAPDGRLLALDADPQALRLARQRLAVWGNRVVFAQGQHRNLEQIARERGFEQVNGIILDLGVSSLQLDDPQRGFSFQEDGPLDMRMGPEAPLTAEQVVNTWSEKDLARVIYEYGEEWRARRVAHLICERRPFGSTRDLAACVARAVGYSGKIHPATRTFQALRIAVNGELESLEAVLPQAVALLAPEGRLAVIAFHSLEDRIVKQFIVRESTGCICPPNMPQCTCGHAALLTKLTKKPLRPTDDEIAANPRSRSARLRVAEKLPGASA